MAPTTTSQRDDHLTTRVDELIRVVYELRGDVNSMKERMDRLERQGALQQQTRTETAGFPPLFWLMLIAGGLVALVMLALLTVRIFAT